jgi:hypothetical protein
MRSVDRYMGAIIRCSRRPVRAAKSWEISENHRVSSRADRDTRPPPRFPFGLGSGPVCLAIARHERSPDAEDHLDLFIGAWLRDDVWNPDARVARTFRLPLSAWVGGEPSPGLYHAVELTAHRAEYLELVSQRVLSDGRGVVSPVARAVGFAHVAANAVECHWDGWRMQLERHADPTWRVHIARSEGATSAGKDGH